MLIKPNEQTRPTTFSHPTNKNLKNSLH